MIVCFLVLVSITHTSSNTHEITVGKASFLKSEQLLAYSARIAQEAISFYPEGKLSYPFMRSEAPNGERDGAN